MDASIVKAIGNKQTLYIAGAVAIVVGVYLVAKGVSKGIDNVTHHDPNAPDPLNTLAEGGSTALEIGSVIGSLGLVAFLLL